MEDIEICSEELEYGTASEKQDNLDKDKLGLCLNNCKQLFAMSLDNWRQLFIPPHPTPDPYSTPNTCHTLLY